MSQAPMTVPNGAPLLVRQGFNNALAALNSQNSGPTAPGDPVAFQYWADTTTGKLKVRNAANTAWTEVYDLWGSPLPIAQGGHGATTLAGAKTALQLVSYEAQTLTAPQQGQARGNIGLGSSATYNIGVSGGAVPLLNAANTWSASQTVEGAGLTVRHIKGTQGLRCIRTDSAAVGQIADAPSVAFYPYGGAQSFISHREVVGAENFFLIAVNEGSSWANYQFYRDGRAVNTSGSWINSSDPDLKLWDDPWSDPVGMLFELSGGEYTRLDTGARGVGLSAADVERIMPSQIYRTGPAYDAEGNLLTENARAIDTAGVGVAVLVEALKVMIRRVEVLEARLA